MEMKTMNKVSIIIPVFNVEKFIDKCIRSVINQTYCNTEIILVDDGSTDSSSGICDKYASENENVFVIHKKNGGLSDARNAGLAKATGDYYMFIDSDDWIEPNMAEELLRFSLESNSEMVVSTISHESEFNKEIHYLPWKEDKIFKSQEIIDKLLPHFISFIDVNGGRIEPIAGSVCKCLYSAELIKSNNLYFDTKVGSGQDKEFNLRVLLSCNSVYTTNNCYYHYNRSIVAGGSSTQRYSPGLYDKVKYRQDCYKRTLREKGLLEQYKKPLDLIWISTIVAVITNLCYLGTNKSIIKLSTDAKRIIEDSKFKELLDSFNTKQLNLIGYKKIKCIETSPLIYILAIKSKNNLKRTLLILKGKIKNEN
jgi:glycosyltransferase involved in cell wall biosynthesis